SSALARTGFVTIGGELFTIQQAGLPCSYQLSPTNASFTAAGGTGSVAVAAPGGCGWTATANDGWITITSGTNGNGNGSVGYAVAVNPTGLPRTGTLTIAGLTFTVN